MKKLLALILFICLTGSKILSQEIETKYRKDSAVPMNVLHVKKVKELELSNQQKKEIKKYKKSNKATVTAIENNSALTEKQKKDQLMQVRKENHAKLETILTPEQKEKMKQMKKDQPRRGVTNMPNERTVKQQ